MMINPKKLFLLDGIGALLSAFLLAVVLVRFESSFGMPTRALNILAVIACIFAAYSLLSYLLVKVTWQPYLRFIAFANLAYCCFTIGLVVYFKDELSGLGLIYFLAEVSVILVLARFELKVSA